MTKRQEKARARRIERARKELQALDLGARQALFRELGCCGCNSLAKAAAKNPAATVGAALGAILGAAFGAAAEASGPAGPIREADWNKIFPRPKTRH